MSESNTFLITLNYVMGVGVGVGSSSALVMLILMLMLMLMRVVVAMVVVYDVVSVAHVMIRCTKVVPLR